MINRDDLDDFEARQDGYYNDQNGWSQEGLDKLEVEMEPMCDDFKNMMTDTIYVTCDGCDQDLYIDQDDPVCVCSCGCVMENPEYSEAGEEEDV